MAEIEKLGRYDIVRVLGKGAMGVVYEGRDPNLDRRVAIKTIRMQSLTPEAAKEYDGRFRTEARSAARLHHPNIVSVFDSGQDDDISYLVMEFIQGDDLKHHLECGARFSVRSAIVMVHELLMALDHAHRQNVVHRDIKPANMLIEASGRIKLTDFGVARIQEPDETHLTQVGGAVGTPKYMSPEQAKGLRGDSRSDVFSAGVVLYELLTGALPFDGENQFAVIHQIVGQEVKPPSTLNPEIPLAMDAVMALAMAKNPDERYATARDFALALRDVAQHMNATLGVQAADVAGELGKHVATRSTPGEHASLRDGSSTGIFGPSVEGAMVTTVNHEAELALWHEIKDAKDPKDLLRYLERFPAGIYARRAQQRIDQLALDNTFTRSKTLPQFRPPPLDLEEEEDLDSTIGPYAPTVPMEKSPEPLQQKPQKKHKDKKSDSSERAAAPVGTVATADGAAPRRKTWPVLAIGGGLLCALLALGVIFRPSSSSVQPDIKETLSPREEVVVSTAHTSAPVQPVVVATQATTTPASTTEAPATVGGASKPAAAASRPVPAVAVATAASAGASRQVKPKASAPVVEGSPAAPREPAPVVASPNTVPSITSSNGAGPSAAGQVCAEKVFIFRIPCIAEQCKSDRFRQTGECLRFKDMERKREEERNNHQR
ncbi:MAG: protein kinase [Pseudomonadota bacterium]